MIVMLLVILDSVAQKIQKLKVLDSVNIVSIKSQATVNDISSVLLASQDFTIAVMEIISTADSTLAQIPRRHAVRYKVNE